VLVGPTSARPTEHQILALGFALSVFGGIVFWGLRMTWREYREALRR
jgi:hypothetical protein